MWKQFRDFMLTGNAIQLAIGIIIGAAFTSVVDSLVNDIIMPPIGALLGGLDFSDIFINLSGEEYDSLTAAELAGAATINVGLFINAVINFVIVILAVFFLVRSVNEIANEIDDGDEDLIEMGPDPKEVLQKQLVEKLDRLVTVLEKQLPVDDQTSSEK